MSTTRRAFVQGIAITGAVVAVAPRFAEASAQAAPVSPAASAACADVERAAVVSFFMDQPYLDPSGRALAYVPPAGMRSAQPLANLSEAAFHSCFCGA
jgi:hypothetical protein